MPAAGGGGGILKLTAFEIALIACSAGLDALQFAELSYVRQGVAERPLWWHDAHALALGAFGLIVAATFAVALASLCVAAAGWARNALATAAVALVAAVVVALTAGLLGVSGPWLVVPLVLAQIAIYVCVPLASAARSAPATPAQALGEAVALAQALTPPPQQLAPDSENLRLLVEGAVATALQRDATLAQLQRLNQNLEQAQAPTPALSSTERSRIYRQRQRQNQS